MNVFNRLLVSLLALAAIALAALVLAIALGWVRPDEVLRAPWSHALEPARLAAGADSRWLVGVCAVLVPLAMGLFVLEWCTLRRRPHLLTVRKSPHGAVTVAMRSVREMADRLGGEHPQVLEIHTRVREQRGALWIAGKVSVAAGEPIPDIAADLQDRIKSGIERSLGRSVAEVRVEAQVGPLSNGHSRAPRVQ